MRKPCSRRPPPQCSHPPRHSRFSSRLSRSAHPDCRATEQGGAAPQGAVVSRRSGAGAADRRRRCPVRGFMQVPARVLHRLLGPPFDHLARLLTIAAGRPLVVNFLACARSGLRPAEPLHADIAAHPPRSLVIPISISQMEAGFWTVRTRRAFPADRTDPRRRTESSV